MIARPSEFGAGKRWEHGIRARETALKALGISALA